MSLIIFKREFSCLLYISFLIIIIILIPPVSNVNCKLKVSSLFFLVKWKGKFLEEEKLLFLRHPSLPEKQEYPSPLKV